MRDLAGLFVLFLFIAAIVTLSAHVGAAIAENEMQREAVKHHAAHWVVDNAGHTTFVWNEQEVADGE